MIVCKSWPCFQNFYKLRSNFISNAKIYKSLHEYKEFIYRFSKLGFESRIRLFHIQNSHISDEFQQKFSYNPESREHLSDNNVNSKIELDSLTDGHNSPQFRDCSHRKSKLNKRTLKNIKAIERLYKVPKDSCEDDFPLHCTINVETAIKNEPFYNETDKGYEHVKKLVKTIYKSSSDRVYNDALWKRYSQKLLVVLPLLHPTDICLVLHSFSKIRDKNLLNSLYPLIIRNIVRISPTGLSLIMNSLKRLEAPNYGLIDIVTNEFCLNMEKANVQDIVLVANSLSFFQVYHIKFWNSLYKSLLIRHQQIDPFQASLLLASLAKLDIRVPLMLKILKRRIRPGIEMNNLSPALVSLVFHSLAKLDFEARYFYSSCVNSFCNFISQDYQKVDSQALVLFLYTSVCILEPRLEVVERCLNILSHRNDYLKSYKMIKLKYVLDHLNHKHKDFVDSLSEELKSFLNEIKEFRIKKIIKKLPRWAFEVSMILMDSNVEHKKSVLFNYLYADIYIKDHNFVIKCTGPYSYYTKSDLLTKFARIEQETFAMKGFNVGILPYYEWNRLKTNEEKINYLKNFGEESALSLYNQ